MKTWILLGTTKRVSLLILLTGFLTAFSVGPAMAGRPTPVTCGSVIAAPGQYVLASDCTGPGITIAASDVHLKLNGHTITGTGGPAPGIFAGSNVSDVHIEGPGTIRSFDAGIYLQASDSHVEQVKCINNFTGLYLGQGTTNTHVNNSVFSMNTGSGLAGGPNTSDNHLNNNQAINNDVGIGLVPTATNYHINGNTALGNAFDLVDGNANCDDNKWDGNTFVTANQPCIH